MVKREEAASGQRRLRTSRGGAARSSGEPGSLLTVKSELGYRGSTRPGRGRTQQEPGRGLRFPRGKRKKTAVTIELRETGGGGVLGQDAGHREGRARVVKGVEPE